MVFSRKKSRDKDPGIRIREIFGILLKRNKKLENIDKEYQEALDFLFSQLPMFSRVGAAAYKPGLDTSLALDAYFGHPHRRFKSIHVAGTNGKGSTSHSLAAVLGQQGYKTALYTSPHLADFRERMRINGEMIPKEKVVDFVRRWRENDYQGHPSFFELTMMMAFDWFASEEVDYAVIEVGMGGRLDSTNIISPELCVITNISADHTQFLGSTPEEIAVEKAGIIKEGIPVVIGEAEGKVREVFESKAKAESAPIIFAQDTPLLESAIESEGGWLCRWKGGTFRFPLGGDYQLKNIDTILHSIEAMRAEGIELSSESVTEGLEGVDSLTGLRGRWMKLAESPLTIADTGHNVAGITYNMNQLKRLLSNRKDSELHMVIGFVADKAIDKILELLPRNAHYYITNANIPRALPAGELKKKFDAAGLCGEVFENVDKAYHSAVSAAKGNDIVFVGGSTFIVADLLLCL